MWRWDQGRLTYFSYDVLEKMASALVQFDNVDISTCEQAFRTYLETNTGMPFLPANYTIKRNYSRVFQCSLLASFVGNKLIVTDICRSLASGNQTIRCADDYFLHYISNFRFPFPAFDHYDTAQLRIYPFCAILKYLLAIQELGLEPKVSPSDIFHFIIGNNCTGCENLAYYKSLLPTNYAGTPVEQRQVREMLIFFSQLSILKMHHGYLYLDTLSNDAKTILLTQILQPQNRIPKASRIDEFSEITSIGKRTITSPFEFIPSTSADLEFLEGDRKRSEHFRIERSTLLRKYFREANPTPICSACHTDMHNRYRWTDYLLEIHHLLPLSSPIAITGKGTSLNDIVGLCPSCHRAVHTYYRKWLKQNNQHDFQSKQQAFDIFAAAIKEIRL